MTEEEFQTKLEELGVVAEHFDNPPHGKSVRFRHPLMGALPGVSYSQEAIDDLKTHFEIDGQTEVWASSIVMLKQHLDLIAIRLIEKSDPDAFFELYNFGHLEELIEKYPRLTKIVANPEWKPK